MPVPYKISNWDLGRSRWYVRYGVAAIFVLLALLLQFLPAARATPFAFFFAAVALSARVCGFGAAIFSTILSAVLADFILLSSRFSFAVRGRDLVRLAFFVIVALLISSLARKKSKAEKDADERRAQLAAVVESSEDAIFNKTLDGTVLTWNRAAQKMYGYRPEEIIGRNVSVLAPPERVTEIPGILHRLRHGEKIAHFETERITRDGRRIHVSLSISPVFDEEGKISQAATIARDITDRIAAEAALHRAEKLATAGELGATIAHEMNNPLAAVTNLAYLIRKNKSLDQKARQQLELLDRELARMAHMTRRTLGFYRDTSSPVSADMRQIMDEVLDLYTRKIESRAITVQKEYQAHPEVAVFPGEIRKVFSNLIANAIDAIRGQGTITVRVRNSYSWNHSALPGARITVADSGTGINPADRHKIFEPFYTTKKDTGTGLGLWLSKDIVKKHGGSISVRSKSTGTVFSVFIPAKSVPGSAKIDGERQTA
ncbi:MAG TPA: PAS domain S-box protein [Candidatus Angelobacter sp.]